MRSRLLIVDDSKTIRGIVRRALKSYDCDVFEALNGVDGLAVAAKLLPDLILLDVTMPVLGGRATLTRLKIDPALAEIPVVMLTRADGADGDSLAWKEARDFLNKPLQEKRVLEICRALISIQPRA